jgi:hypothetical protein
MSDLSEIPYPPVFHDSVLALLPELTGSTFLEDGLARR